MTEIEGYLSITETAARLGCCRQTVWRHIRAGDLPTYRTARNSRVRLIDVTDIEAIERVTPETRQRKDWSGKDWTDYMIEAAANRTGARMVEILDTDIYAESEPDSAERLGSPPPASDGRGNDLVVLDTA